MFKSAEVIVRFQETGVYGPRIFLRAGSEKGIMEVYDVLSALSIWKGCDKTVEIEGALYHGFEFENNAQVLSALNTLFGEK